MPTNDLPELKSGHKLNPAPAGKWSGFDSKTELVNLADGLNVPLSPVDRGERNQPEICSIPDPWGRVMLFADALLHKDHRDHAKVLGEWRGLLAILALKELRNFKELNALPISLSFKVLRESTLPQGSFLRTVATIKPANRELIFTSSTWEDFHLLKWASQSGGPAKVLGMTSPTTLVATGVYYAESLNNTEIPWFKPPVFNSDIELKSRRALVDGGLLVSPTSDHLSETERIALGQWLNYLRIKLSRSDAHLELLDRLESYRDDMLAGLRVDLTTDENKIFSKATIGFSGGDVYALIDRPAKVETPVLSDLMLVANSGNQHYILLDGDVVLPDKSGKLRRAKDIAFYGDISLAVAPRHYRGNGVTGVLDERRHLSYCTKEFFFEKDLVYLDSDGELKLTPGCLDVNVNIKASHNCSQFRQALFPITEKAAELFSPEEWEQRCELTWASPTEAVFSIRLEVKTVSNTDDPAAPPVPKTIVLKKIYTKDFLHRATGTLPLIGIWPNVRFQDEPARPNDDNGPRNRWQRYFLFQSWRGGASKERELELRARPLKEGDSKRLIKHGSEYVQIRRLPRFPQVLVCETPREVEMQNASSQVKGLLFLKPPELILEKAERDVVLGVDFGTTGTSIYRAFFGANATKTEGAEPVILQDRFVRVTASSAESLRSITRELFIPAKRWSAAKILSIYQDLLSSEEAPKDSDQRRLTITNGHVLFADSSDPKAFVSEAHRGSVRSDLKWGKSQIVQRAAKDFVTQLCMQSVLELVCDGARSVEVRYSYPTAFDESDLADFANTWESVIIELRKVTSSTIEESHDVTNNYEAIAAARYFKTNKGWTPGGGALTLDIGGGTTDIALWNAVGGAPTLLSHSSVLFAGRDIFLAPIREFPQVLESIRDPDNDSEPVPEFKETKEQLGTAFSAQIDAHIQMYGDMLMKHVSARDTKDNLMQKEFLRIIELGLCGIAFYAGLQWGRMLATGSAAAAGEKPDSEAVKQEVAALETASLIRIYIGGNGSKLLKWCGKGSFRPLSDIYKHFARSLQNGVSEAAPGTIAKNVDIRLSDDPKEEVAAGLVQNGRQTERSLDFSKPLAGESFVLNSTDQRSWSDPLDSVSLHANLIEVGDRVKMASPSGGASGRLPVFHAFLQSVDERMDDSVLEEIAFSVNERLGEIKDDMFKASHNSNERELDRENPVRAEPIFFLAMKFLIEQKIRALGETIRKDAGK